MRWALVIHSILHIIVNRTLCWRKPGSCEPVQSVGASESVHDSPYHLLWSSWWVKRTANSCFDSKWGTCWCFWNCVAEIINNQQPVMEVNTYYLAFNQIRQYLIQKQFPTLSDVEYCRRCVSCKDKARVQKPDGTQVVRAGMGASEQYSGVISGDLIWRIEKQ